jgi:hypothetical protein
MDGSALRAEGGAAEFESARSRPSLVPGESPAKSRLTPSMSSMYPVTAVVQGLVSSLPRGSRCELSRSTGQQRSPPPFLETGPPAAGLSRPQRAPGRPNRASCPPSLPRPIAGCPRPLCDASASLAAGRCSGARSRRRQLRRDGSLAPTPRGVCTRRARRLRRRPTWQQPLRTSSGLSSRNEACRQVSSFTLVRPVEIALT